MPIGTKRFTSHGFSCIPTSAATVPLAKFAYLNVPRNARFAATPSARNNRERERPSAMAIRKSLAVRIQRNSTYHAFQRA